MSKEIINELILIRIGDQKWLGNFDKTNRVIANAMEWEDYTTLKQWII